MKKRPPPGAMLVARLKERRLAREQQSSKSNEIPGEELDNKTDEPIETKESQAGQILSITTFETETNKIEIESSFEEQLAASTELIPTKKSKTSRKDNLIRRQIELEDLRPSTDDYKQLTEEIRLAGRFASVGLIAQGLRLARLKDVQLYKDHYQTFEDYCRKEHHMSGTYAYRLIRMAEMADQLADHAEHAQALTNTLFDPFEVMLGLGHRHLMAILPLEIDTVRDVLAMGIPVVKKDGSTGKRIPLNLATEKQIRDAIKKVHPDPEIVTANESKKLVLPADKQLVPALGQMVQMVEDWATFLSANGTPAELRAAKMVRKQLLERIANRLRRAAEVVAFALEKSDNDD